MIGTALRSPLGLTLHGFLRRPRCRSALTPQATQAEIYSVLTAFLPYPWTPSALLSRVYPDYTSQSRVMHGSRHLLTMLQDFQWSLTQTGWRALHSLELGSSDTVRNEIAAGAHAIAFCRSIIATEATVRPQGINVTGSGIAAYHWTYEHSQDLDFARRVQNLVEATANRILSDNPMEALVADTALAHLAKPWRKFSVDMIRKWAEISPGGLNVWWRTQHAFFETLLSRESIYNHGPFRTNHETIARSNLERALGA